MIELLVTLAVIALLVSLALPQYFGSLDKAKETVLRENLHQMRDAISKYYGDNNRYPNDLETLVTRNYLRKIPPDPITDDDKSWVTVPPGDPRKGNVYDVRSSAPGTGRDGTPYASW